LKLNNIIFDYESCLWHDAAPSTRTDRARRLAEKPECYVYYRRLRRVKDGSDYYPILYRLSVKTGGGKAWGALAGTLGGREARPYGRIFEKIR
jgi:hypothetical protein